MSDRRRAQFEEAISRIIVPVGKCWPRPWFTHHDPMSCSLLLVGASSAKTFRVEDLPRTEDVLDAHFNRNGASCQDLYDRLAGSPSPTRRNITRATDILEAAGWRVMQTNVTCASAPLDRDISQPARQHGTGIFRAVAAHVPWRAMIVFGAGAAKRLGKTLDLEVPPPADLRADPDAGPRITWLEERPVLVIPTMAPPAYRQTVWPYLEHCMSALGQPEGR